MKNKRGKLMILACLTGMLAAAVQMPQQSQAARTPEIDKAKANVQVKKKVTLHLKHAKKKVRWKSNNKAIAVVKDVSGKKKQKVMVYGKKEGKCNIIAQSDGHKYSCRLTVKKKKLSSKPEEEKPDEKTSAITPGAIGAYVSGVSATERSLSVEVTYYNGSNNPGQEAVYGESFAIQKKEGDSWVAVESEEAMVFPAIAILLRNQTEQKETYTMPKTAKPLTSGRYRIKLFLNAGYINPDDKNQPTYQEPVIYDQPEFDVIVPAGTGNPSVTETPPAQDTPHPTSAEVMPATAPPMAATAVPPVATAPPMAATAVPPVATAPICTQNPNVTQGKMGAEVKDVKHTDASIDVTIRLYNGFYDWQLGYSYVFSIEKMADGQWTPVTSKDPQAFPCVMILLNPQSEGEMTYRIEDTTDRVTAGHYRLCTSMFPMGGMDGEKPEVETAFEFDIP